MRGWDVKSDLLFPPEPASPRLPFDTGEGALIGRCGAMLFLSVSKLA